MRTIAAFATVLLVGCDLGSKPLLLDGLPDSSREVCAPAPPLPPLSEVPALLPTACDNHAFGAPAFGSDEFDDFAAANIAWDLGQGVRFDPTAYERIHHDLEVLRRWSQDPTFATNSRLCGAEGEDRGDCPGASLPPYFPEYSGRLFGLTVSPTLFTQIVSGTNRSMMCVLTHFGAEADPSASPSYLFVSLAQPHGLAAIRNSLTSIEGVVFIEGPLDVGSDQPTRFKVSRISDVVRYVFAAGWDYCFDGCINWEYTLIESTDECGPRLRGRWSTTMGSPRPDWAR